MDGRCGKAFQHDLAADAPRAEAVRDLPQTAVAHVQAKSKLYGTPTERLEVRRQRACVIDNARRGSAAASARVRRWRQPQGRSPGAPTGLRASEVGDAIVYATARIGFLRTTRRHWP